MFVCWRKKCSLPVVDGTFCPGISFASFPFAMRSFPTLPYSLCERKNKQKSLRTFSKLPKNSGTGVERPSLLLEALPRAPFQRDFVPCLGEVHLARAWTHCIFLWNLNLCCINSSNFRKFQPLTARAQGTALYRLPQQLAVNEWGKFLRRKKTNKSVCNWKKSGPVSLLTSFYMTISHIVILDWEHLNLPLLLTERHITIKRSCLEQLLMARADALRWKPSSE